MKVLLVAEDQVLLLPEAVLELGDLAEIMEVLVLTVVLVVMEVPMVEAEHQEAVPQTQVEPLQVLEELVLFVSSGPAQLVRSHQLVQGIYNEPLHSS